MFSVFSAVHSSVSFLHSSGTVAFEGGMGGRFGASVGIIVGASVGASVGSTVGASVGATVAQSTTILLCLRVLFLYPYSPFPPADGLTVGAYVVA